MSTKEKLIGLLIVVVLIFTGSKLLEDHTSGPDFIDTPIQQDLNVSREIIKEGRDGPVTLKLLAEYNVTAVVKSIKKYSNDLAAAISPMDFVLAWGNLNKQEIDKTIKYSQSGRWYYYKQKEGSIISLYDIQINSANTHIIPSDTIILKQLKKIDENDLVNLKGYLVSAIFDPKQAPWTSSLTRFDSGDRACEIFYVTSVKIK